VQLIGTSLAGAGFAAAGSHACCCSLAFGWTHWDPTPLRARNLVLSGVPSNTSSMPASPRKIQAEDIGGKRVGPCAAAAPTDADCMARQALQCMLMYNNENLITSLILSIIFCACLQDARERPLALVQGLLPRLDQLAQVGRDVSLPPLLALHRLKVARHLRALHCRAAQRDGSQVGGRCAPLASLPAPGWAACPRIVMCSQCELLL
jgi:hypothetical protein